MPRIAPIIQLRQQQLEQLEALRDDKREPARIRLRAAIVLKAAKGESNQAISGALNVPELTVGKWRKRFVAHGIHGLSDQHRSGRRRSMGIEKQHEAIVQGRRPEKGQHRRLTCEEAAAKQRVSKTTIHRLWTEYGVRRKKQRAEMNIRYPPRQLRGWAELYSLQITSEFWIVTTLCGELNWQWEDSGFENSKDEVARTAEWRLVSGISVLSHCLEQHRKTGDRRRAFQQLWEMRPKAPFDTTIWHVLMVGGRSGLAKELWGYICQHPRIRCYTAPAYADREKVLLGFLKDQRICFPESKCWCLMPEAEDSVFKRLVSGHFCSGIYEWSAIEDKLIASSGAKP